MKKLLCLLPAISALFLVSCNRPAEKELSDREKAVMDSLSKATQKAHGDSMKRENPLLIVPPDSTYTGEYTDKYPSGIVKFKGYFRFGKRHGQWMSFYPSGLKWSELHYDKGLREGPNQTYFESGTLRYEGWYKNDMQDSTWNYYDSTGKIAAKVIFKEDKIIRQLPIK